jgi:catechol 2,3-dioxygenase-like lactoylglutathione lyase family enzyme
MEQPSVTDWASELTHILVVDDLASSTAFYRDVLGASVFREYGGSSCVLQLKGTWLLLVTGGPPTPDKPRVSFAVPGDPDRVSHSMTFRVKDAQQAHEVLESRGAEFLAPLSENDWEIRGFFRDPDGHLLEISQAKT